ncbi:amidohydrolase family protein [uncultured Roseibium sp.]|uniref:amidohydrolase family protein n=1 Tax=uncultured Roseibium sp. TaxID=1936171 RepID=UPI0032165516
MSAEKNGPGIIALEEHFMHPTLAGYLGPAADPPSAIRDRLYDFAGIRIQEMDAAGIDMQVLSHQSPGSQRLSDEVALEACRNVNDALATVIREAPHRFAGFAMIPTMMPQKAADELTRAVEDLGLKGAMIHGLSRGRFTDGEDFWPIYERAAALDVPIYLHPALPDKSVTASYYAPYDESHPALVKAAWGFGVETGTHAVRLILSGVFDRYPDLKIILGHLGEAIPFLLPRIDEALSRPENASTYFGDIFRNNFHITTSGFFSDAALQCCLEAIGADHILFAVDWPYVSNTDGVAWLRNSPIEEGTKNAIFNGNAKKLLRL